jgi:uncharacterized protein YjbI with pentapeptide repeats
MAAIEATATDEQLDLLGADLSDLDLSDMDLEGARLWGADLRGANLQGANLWGAGLQGANMGAADLRGACLQAATLWGSDLGGADLRGADLKGANLQGADLSGAELAGVDLRELDALGGLKGVKLFGAKMQGARLSMALLSGRIGEEISGDYLKARKVYSELRENFESLGAEEAAAWAYIKERQMGRLSSAPWNARRLHGGGQFEEVSGRRLPARHLRVWIFYLRHTARWCVESPLEWVSGYGERPWRACGVSVAAYLSMLGILWLSWGAGMHSGLEGMGSAVPTRNLWNLVRISLGPIGRFGAADLSAGADWMSCLSNLGFFVVLGLSAILGHAIYYQRKKR